MNPHTILRLFPNASAATIAANAKDYGDHHPTDSRQAPVVECDSGSRPLAASEAQAQGSGRVHIRFESVRQRLCDPDNLCEKWLLDCLRNCGAIAGDEPDKITLETCQRKAAKGEAETTIITITYPSLSANRPPNSGG